MVEFSLITNSAEPIGVKGRVGFLFETARDGSMAKRFPDAAPLIELIGDLRETRLKAAALAAKVLADEPRVRGVQQLGIFEEMVIEELRRIFHAIYLHETLNTLNVTNCHFSGISYFSSLLAVLVRQTGSGILIDAPVTRKGRTLQRLKRSWRRLFVDQLSGQALRRELRLALERIDPFHLMPLWRHGSPDWESGQIWFYTTATTFTNIGLLYEECFPSRFNYLVENPTTGGAPLERLGRDWLSIYNFGDAKFVPDHDELAAAKAVIRHHLENKELRGFEATARDMFLQGDLVATFFERLLPTGLYLTTLFRNWAKRTEASALVVGNAVFEGYALHAAREHSINTILLQHGILGDFCPFIDPPVDHYIVRGRVWQEFLSAKAAIKSVILNPAYAIPARSALRGKRSSILFLSAPYSAQDFWETSDRLDILSVILQVAFEQNVEVIIRVHPMESVNEYRAIIAKLDKKGTLTFSQGSDLNLLLERSAVAVTFSSTAFLDCLKHQVPVVSFEWHDFCYKSQIVQHGAFHFAANLDELGKLLQRAVEGALPAFSGDMEFFLSSTPSEEMMAICRGLVAPAATTLFQD